MGRWDTIPMPPEQQAKMDALAARGFVGQVRAFAGTSILLGLVSWVFDPFLLVGIAGIGAALACVALVAFMGSGIRPHVPKAMVLIYLVGAAFGGLIAALRTLLGLMAMSG